MFPETERYKWGELYHCPVASGTNEVSPMSAPPPECFQAQAMRGGTQANLGEFLEKWEPGA